jgi:hypothetical protein
MSRLRAFVAKAANSAFFRRANDFARRLATGKTRNAPMPVIVGAPRSGTTLLRLMLDAHPELAIPPETGFLVLGKQLSNLGGDPVGAFVEAVTNFPTDAPVWADFQISADQFRAELQKLKPFSVAEGFRVFYRMYAARFGKPRWGDKTPMYGRYLIDIEGLLPEARFIHLIRDGRDVAVSLREQWFSPGRDIEVQATFWRDHVLESRRQGAACRNYLEVRLEDLVQNTEAVLRRICTFCELPWHAHMLRHHERAAIRLEEHVARVRKDGSTVISRKDRLRQQAASQTPPDPARIGIWHSRLSALECRQFDAIAGDLLSELGYRVDCPSGDSRTMNGEAA